MLAQNHFVSMANNIVLDNPLGHVDEPTRLKFDLLVDLAIDEGDKDALEALLDTKYLLCIRNETRESICVYLEKSIEDVDLIDEAMILAEDFEDEEPTTKYLAA